MQEADPIPTESVYATNGMGSWPSCGGSSDQLSELFEYLRTRDDRGAPFWRGVRAMMESVPDEGPQPPRPIRSVADAQRPGLARHEWIVYYLRFSDRVKIGTTTHLPSRLAAIPFDEVLAVEPGAHAVEARRHRQFADLRVKREWFRYEGALAEHIAGLQ